MRAPAWAGALNALWSDVLALLPGDLTRGAAYETERHGDIVVPAIDVWPELDARSVPERRVIHQPHRDFGLELDGTFVSARQRFLE